MSTPPVAAAEVGRAYDERAPIGDALREGQLHMWYWYDDTDDAPLAEAVRRIGRKVTETLGLREGEHVLDAGCGPGETAVMLARTYGVRVTGVTVSEYEVGRARERARHSGLGDVLSFQNGDYASLPFPDGSFDAVLALETLMYAADLDRVLAELFRVLRPRGRLALSDFSLESLCEPERVEKFMRSLKLNVLLPLPEWVRRLEAAGFRIEEHTQCGPRVFGMKSKYLTAAMEHHAEITERFGAEAVTAYSRAHQGFFAPRKDQIGYIVIAARKP
ncbi:methyltransferase domain-containing protein [Micromonospora profundi]|uniref:Methyltransferase domain-containing protein n=1 Tax=Micromonospora profundi TaxID=1420889 RepID=A0AAJ6HRK5_9ACTN|nr:methyltransferase domain-containing protein [Micromonospora profundi]WLS43315.1 methyltransferase domain-containing protein [Micromonospora profundi]